MIIPEVAVTAIICSLIGVIIGLSISLVRSAYKEIISKGRKKWQD